MVHSEAAHVRRILLIHLQVKLTDVIRLIESFMENLRKTFCPDVIVTGGVKGGARSVCIPATEE